MYVRTQIQNPVLSLTTSVTLRDRPQKAKKAGANAETGSIHSAADTVRTDGTEEAVGEDEDMAGMEEIDLLGGLGECSPSYLLLLIYEPANNVRGGTFTFVTTRLEHP